MDEITHISETEKNQSQYLYVINQIKKQILSGQLVLGDRLPPERDLATQYQVSRNSIREAMRVLQGIGLLECRQGSGNYISNHLKERLSDSLSLVFLLDHCRMEDLTALRQTFELQIMKEIMQKKEPAVMRSLEELSICIRLAKNTDEIEELDVKFHMLIASLASNPLIQFLHSSIYSSYLENIRFLNVVYPRWSKVSLEYAKEYQLDIINAIFSGNVTRFEKALHHHYEYTDGLNMDTLYQEYLKNGNPKRNRDEQDI